MSRSIPSWRTASRVGRHLLLCAPLALLAACGGGGGSGGDATPTPVGSALVLTSANAKPATADALATATTTDAAEAGSALVTGVQVQAGSGAPVPFAQAVLALARKAPGVAAFVQGTTINQTEQCALGGSINISGSVAGNGLAVGDSVRLTASSCQETVDGRTTTMSGSINIVVTAGGLSGTGGFPVDITMSVTATNFTVSGGGQTGVANGDMSMRVQESSSTASTLTLTGNALSNSITTSSGTRSWTQRNYSQTIALNGSAATYTLSADIETTNSRLASGATTYSVRTPSALAVNAAGEFTAGSLGITGKSSALLATVTATNTFQIQVDTNGDGTFDSTTTATLAELRAL